MCRAAVPVELDLSADTNDQWRAILAEALDRAKTFRIHCWKEETAELALALPWGHILDSGWAWGTIVTGPVTPAFRDFILSRPKPTDTEIYNKMTPFFSIFLDDRFCSEHYGTELYRCE